MIRMIEWALSFEAPGIINVIAFALTLATLVGALLFSVACLMVGHWVVPVLIWIVAPVAIIAAAYKRRGE